MGLNNGNGGGNTIFVRASKMVSAPAKEKGKFIFHDSNEGDAGAETFTYNLMDGTPKTVTRTFYRNLEAYPVGLTYSEREAGGNTYQTVGLQLKDNDGGTISSFQFQMKWGGVQTNRFFQIVDCINPANPLTINGKIETGDDNIERLSLGFLQPNPEDTERKKYVKWNHTKANPNGMPEITIVKGGDGNPVVVNGKEVRDNSARMNFFRAKIETINAKWQAAFAANPVFKAGASAPVQPAPVAAPVENEEEMDLV